MDRPDTKDLTVVGPEEAERGGTAADPNAPVVGKWFWFKERVRPGDDDDDEELEEEEESELEEDVEVRERFVCCTHVGSNYAEVEDVGGVSWRIHQDKFHEWLRAATDPEGYIQSMVLYYQGEVGGLMERVRSLTAGLSVGTEQALNPASTTQALAVRGSGREVEDYKTALVKAKEVTLPNLFKEIEEANECMSRWLTAPLVPLKAQREGYQSTIKTIESRIFNVELYAGLTESVEQVKAGEPASVRERIRLHQRMCFMDEECLLDYDAGGMEFKGIGKFDEWLLRPGNLERLLPHPKCIVAFRVRREEKEREFAGWREFISFSLSGKERLDEKTFLYIRNGENVYRLATSVDFECKVFPDRERMKAFTGECYATREGEKIISKGEYEQMVQNEARAKEEAEEDYQRQRREYAPKLAAYRTELNAWRRQHPDWKRTKRDVFWSSEGAPDEPDGKPWKTHVWGNSTEYQPWDKGNVYSDDISKALLKQMDRHNRLVLILQGLLDRSPVLHPHPHWQLWTPEGFESALELVFDVDRVLVAGPKPDFEAYRRTLNDSLRTGSVVVGQQEAWEVLEAEKYNRSARSDRWQPKRYKPNGNDGPGACAVAKNVGKRGCTFKWTRQRSGTLSYEQRHYQGLRYDDRLPCSVTLPLDQLLNASAYEPGDYRQFFNDPRTRAEYLEWAPLLLLAEDFKAGKRKPEKEKK